MYEDQSNLIYFFTFIRLPRGRQSPLVSTFTFYLLQHYCRHRYTILRISCIVIITFEFQIPADLRLVALRCHVSAVKQFNLPLQKKKFHTRFVQVSPSKSSVLIEDWSLLKSKIVDRLGDMQHTVNTY